jgi:hypothetical protein
MKWLKFLKDKTLSRDSRVDIVKEQTLLLERSSILLIWLVTSSILTKESTLSLGSNTQSMLALKVMTSTLLLSKEFLKTLPFG